MAVVLAISSQVAKGYVGNSAAALALQALRHEVWQIPTVVLSNHPGHPRTAGTHIPAETCEAMLQALEDNGWLNAIDAVMTGYLPTAGHVEVVATWLKRIGSPAPARYFCDPILGDDDQGLYIDEAAAAALRDRLIPRAEIITPNRFELAWLSARTVATASDAAAAAGWSDGPQTTIATSVPADAPDRLSNVLWLSDAASPSGRSGCWRADVARRDRAPHGTGDLLAGLYFAHLLNDAPAADAFARAVAGVDAAIAACHPGADELELARSSHQWSDAAPATLREISAKAPCR